MLTQGKLLRNVLILNMDKQLEDISTTMYQKEISALDDEQLFIVVVFMVKTLIETFVKSIGEKKLFYISNKFAKGSFLENNLKNLGIYEILEGVLVSKNQELSALNQVEKEYMGNQNSFEATSRKFFERSMDLGLPAEAFGIRQIRNIMEQQDNEVIYCDKKSWLTKQDVRYALSLEQIRAKASYYDMDVVGKNKEVYKFHLFDFEIEDEIKSRDVQIYYDYFLAHCSVKMILQQLRTKQYDLRKMDSYARIETEGENLSLIIPELVRIMVDEKAIPIEEAIEVVRKSCGYEDYASLIDAVQSCPMEYVEKLVPNFVEKIQNTKVKRGVE